MDEIQALLARNRQWAAQMEQEEPGLFARLSGGQSPRFLWIGCADSRVPPEQVTGLLPGELFVHRNVANVVLETDINCMSVLAFAIREIRVRHIIVCGHYGCAGVGAAMEDGAEAPVSDWLSSIRELWLRHSEELSSLAPAQARARLCELNVLAQVRSLCRTRVLNRAWENGQAVDVHGWIYGVEDGLIRDLGIRVSSQADRILQDNG